jgi:hypothetical protein
MNNDPYRRKNKREFYRIRYPISCRPTLTYLGEDYEVVNISERGVRFICKKLHEFKPDLEMQFSITFRDDEPLEIEGKILRVEGKVAVIYLPENIPFGRIVQEQRYIKDNYPDYF